MPSNRIKKNKKKWEENLEKIYYTLGGPGAFYSTKKLQKVLLEKFRQKVKEKNIEKWLQGQNAYTIHRNRRKNFKRNPILAFYINHNWQADLGFLTKYKKYNKGFTCFLLVIDVVSRFIWGRPLKTKEGPETTAAFEEILKETAPNKPEKLQTDGGSEFFNKHFKQLIRKHGIDLYKTESDQKAAIAERAIKTIKSLISRYMTSNQTNDWASVFQNILKTYNNTYHSSIKMKPSQVNFSNQKVVLENLYGFIWEKDTFGTQKPKFKVGDFVRLSKVKHVFKKGYEGNWSDEIFQISKVQRRTPYFVYEVYDYSKTEKIKGTFYEHELTKVNIAPATYWKVEKILKKKFMKNKLWYLIKFMHYDKPEWILAENVADVEKVKRKLK